jgi:uncharacterized protein (TIGR02300 family)
MAKKKLGKKYACYQCGCKFYDLSKPKPICPKCGADQNDAPTRETPSLPKAGPTAAVAPRTRGRRRRDDDDSIEPSVSFSDDEMETGSPLEDGLSMIDDEELIGAGGDEYPEED